MRLWAFVLMHLSLLAPGCSEAEQNGNLLTDGNLLTISKGNRDRVVFLDKDFSLPEEEAATFLIEKDSQHGSYLAVGQWRAGKWSARFQYAKKIPTDRATIRGLYQTVDIKPFEAATVDLLLKLL